MAETRSTSEDSERAAGAGKGIMARVGGANLFAYISFFVAALSLVTSFYQGYLNTKFVELVQSSVARNETARTCKDLIDGYFQIKLRAASVAAAMERERNANAASAIAAESEAANAVSRFAALGTYLANFQGEAARAKYTELSHELARVVASARSAAPAAVEKLFEKADVMFTAMNDDCVKTATRRI